MTATLPTLSVVMPNYNHARYLPAAIEEILNQTRPPDEFLILDDASTDNSRDIIAEYAAKHSVIRVLHNDTNVGVNEAHRRLFEESTGDYVYAGAADDRRFPRFFEQAMRLAEKHSQAGLISGAMTVFDENDEQIGEITIRRWHSESNGLFAEPLRVLTDYLDVEAPSHSLCGATVYRREALQSVGWYRDELGFWGDTFSARAIALRRGMAYIPEPVAGFRRLPGSFSGAGRDDPRQLLEVVKTAADMMRSDEFNDAFPADHVARWKQRYRRLIAWNTWLGDGVGFRPLQPAFWWRAVRGIPRMGKALSILNAR